MSFSSCLYAGQVFHRRNRPKQHVLKYSVFTMLLDLSEIRSLDSALWLFSYNRFNLFGFHEKDFGEHAGEPLTDYVNRKLKEAGIQQQPTQILLSCYPRILGFVFNPLSLFYCYDESGQCFAVVHEVHNTFGERHAYVLPVAEEPQSSQWINQQADKVLFVSPFAHMDMSYQFRLNQPDDRQIIVIKASDKDGLLITASYTASRKSLTASRLMKFFLVFPLLSAKVIVGIHWEALRLYIKGVPWFKHQPKGSS